MINQKQREKLHAVQMVNACLASELKEFAIGNRTICLSMDLFASLADACIIDLSIGEDLRRLAVDVMSGKMGEGKDKDEKLFQEIIKIRKKHGLMF